MRITTPAAQLAAQLASPCSAYKRARSIWQCVVKFFGSASSRSGGRGMPPGKRGCQKVLRRRKLFCIFCPQNGSCLSLPPLLPPLPLLPLLLRLLRLLLPLLVPTSFMSRYVSVFISASGSSFLFF